MTLADRISSLKKSIQELEDDLKYTQATTEQSTKSLRQAQSHMKKPLTEDSLKILKSLYKEVMSNQLEIFRTHSRMIRKVSPRAADYLDEKINKFEKNDRKFQEINFSLETYSHDKVKPIMDEYLVLFDNIENTITLTKMIIHDTIAKFEK